MRTGAESIDAATLKAADIAGLSLSRGLILEDLDRNEYDEQSIFHLLNLSRERDFNMLLTTRLPPSRWTVQLPDLISRLRAIPLVTIGAPDDALLGAVLLKHFSDRQLNVDPHVLKFLARRMIRSMDAAREVVAELDHAALRSGRKISRNEDLDRIEYDEQSIFHLLNLSRERDFNMLLTTRLPPSRWTVQLPDLISRLRAIPLVTIGAPDDALLGAVLLKHFSDRQLNVDPHVLKFLARRMIRSMDAAREVVAELDHAALRSGRKISRHLASEILEQIQKT